ncbi:MAG: M20/M25/M40 family metallo-hydrolase [Promethearchaeota archaeon]
MNDIVTFLDKNQQVILDELTEFCKIPSVAAKGDHEVMEKTASWVANALEKIGLETQIHETKGLPVVTGHLDIGSDKTLLFYNHYDVQPAEPFELWESPPFEPTIRNKRIFARGVSDNKGNTLSRIWAVRAFTETSSELPVNIKFVVEGEEEIGSLNLPKFVNKNREFLKADGGIWEFGGAGPDGRQEAWLGLKGILYVQFETQKLGRDAHSGYGCILPNAAWHLIWAINTLKDQNEQIQIDGFYDDVKPLSNSELEFIQNTELFPEHIKEQFQIPNLIYDLKGIELKKAYYNAPTCTICGISSGWQGPGSKTVIPAEASAKVDFRLVSDQDPDDILSKLRQYLDTKGFNDVTIPWHEGYPAAKTPISHPFIDVVKRATQAVFGQELRIHITSAGSGPLYLFKDLVPMVSVGCADFDSRGHAPNESVSLDLFFLDIKRQAAIFEEMGRRG